MNSHRTNRGSLIAWSTAAILAIALIAVAIFAFTQNRANATLTDELDVKDESCQLAMELVDLRIAVREEIADLDSEAWLELALPGQSATDRTSEASELEEKLANATTEFEMAKESCLS